MTTAVAPNETRAEERIRMMVNAEFGLPLPVPGTKACLVDMRTLRNLFGYKVLRKERVLPTIVERLEAMEGIGYLPETLPDDTRANVLIYDRTGTLGHFIDLVRRACGSVSTVDAGVITCLAAAANPAKESTSDPRD